jgi:PKD domain
MKPLCILVVTAACLAVAGPAAAEVIPEGTGEPAYTNSAQNTQFIRWQNATGYDGYRIHAVYYRDNVQVHDLRANVSMSGGTMWLDWAGVATLEHGRQYSICVQGERLLSGMWFPDGSNSCAAGAQLGRRTHTTIDRSKPTASLVAAGGAEFTKDGSLPVSIGFSDSTAGPYPANFICVKAGAAPCEDGFGYSPACSTPGSSGKSTTFSCNVDASQLPDGPVTVCVIAADAAVPDKPSSADQTGSASVANHSDKQCDTVTLDRQAPALALGAPGTLGLGVAALFSSEASDAGSGIDTATARWDFGDGSAPVSATQTSRGFDRAGTYVVTYRLKDKAGNEATAQKTVTVEAPAGQVSTPGTTPGSTPGATPGQAPAPAVSPGLASVRIGSLTLLVPKRARLGRVRQLLLGARTDQAGTLTLRLTRGRKVLSRLTVGLSPGQSKQRLGVPRRLKAGTYAVKIAFKPAGVSWSTAATAKVAFRK